MKQKSRVSFLFSLILILSFLSFMKFPKVDAVTVYTETFYPDLASRNGFIFINSTTYPIPTTTQYKYFPGGVFTIENSHFASPLQYMIYRSYISFNTSSLPNSGLNVVSAKLYGSVISDLSQKDFNVIVFSGQNQWTNSSTCTWNKCPTYESIMFNTLNLVSEQYYSCSIATGSISLIGLTQFRLINSNEGTTPTSREGVWLYNWTDPDWKPYLQVKWSYASESKLTSIDILNMNYAISDALGLNSPFLGGLIISFAIIFGFIVLPLACLRAPLIAYAVMIFGVCGMFIVLGWLPIWFVFMEVFLIAVMLSSSLSKILTGEG